MTMNGDIAQGSGFIRLFKKPITYREKFSASVKEESKVNFLFDDCKDLSGYLK